MILGNVVSRLFAYFFPLAVKYITILFFWFFFFYRKSATDSINTHTNVKKRNIRNLSPIPLRHLNERSDELHLTPEPSVSFAKIDQLLLFWDHLGFLKHKKMLYWWGEEVNGWYSLPLMLCQISSSDTHCSLPNVVKDPWFNKSWVVLIVILMPLRSYWKTYKRFWFFSLPIWAKARPMRQEILKGFNPDLADTSITKSDKKLCERSPRLKISAIFTCISHKLQKTVFLSLGRHDSHASQFPLFPIRVRS